MGRARNPDREKFGGDTRAVATSTVQEALPCTIRGRVSGLDGKLAAKDLRGRKLLRAIAKQIGKVKPDKSESEASSIETPSEVEP